MKKETSRIINFPLNEGHYIQILCTRQITKEEFETIKKVIELCEPGFVEPQPPAADTKKKSAPK